MCQGLVGHYFLLTQEDLQLWDEDPETFGKYKYCVDCGLMLLLFLFLTGLTT